VKLRSIVRDLRYIPKLASEVALCISKSKNPAFRERGKKFLEQVKNSSGQSTNDGDDEDDDAGSSFASQSSDEDGIDPIRLAEALKNRLSFKLQAKMKAMMISKKRRRNKDKDNDDDDFDDLDDDDISNADRKSEVEETIYDKIQGRREISEVDDSSFLSELDYSLASYKSLPASKEDNDNDFSEGEYEVALL
jgi:hypothetical protein